MRRRASLYRWVRGFFSPVMIAGLCATAAAEGPKQKLDLRAADLAVRTLDGVPTRLAPYAGKKLTLLNLWATWCGPCRDEMPALARMHAQYKAQGFSVVGVDIDESAATVKKFLARNKVSYPMLLSTEGKTVMALGELEALPTSLLLDENGEVLEVLVGGIEVPELAAAVEKGLGLVKATKK